MPRIIVRPLAYMDLDDLAECIARSNENAAQRLLVAAEQTFVDLSKLPEIGTPYHFSNDRLHDLRCWPVSGFNNYLIFYRPVEGGVEILRILHGARDRPALFQEKL